MTILVTGATGTVARLALEQLLATGAEVSATSRNPQTANLPAGVQVHAADLANPESLVPAIAGVEHVFLYASAIKDPAAVTTVLAEHGRPHVVLLSTYAVAEKDAENNYNAQRHVVVENALSAAGLPTTFLRPSTFALNTLGWAASVRNEGRVSLPFPDIPFAPIHELDIAAVAVAALTREEMVGTAPVLTGPEFLTQAQQVETIAAGIGKPLQVHKLTHEQVRAQFLELYPPALAESFLGSFERVSSIPTALTNAVEDITGHPARSYAAWVDDHLDDFS